MFHRMFPRLSTTSVHFATLLGFVTSGALSETSVPSPEHFDSLFHSALSSSPNDLLIYVYAEHIPSTGQSWCPDCVRAEPIVLSRARGYNVLSVPVPRSEYKGNLEYALRVHPLLQLQALPQLYRVDRHSGRLVGTLVELECCDQDKLDQLLGKLIE